VGNPPTARKARRRTAVRWTVHGLLFVALAVGVFGLLPRIGGPALDAAGLRHARQASVVAALRDGGTTMIKPGPAATCSLPPQRVDWQGGPL